MFYKNKRNLFLYIKKIIWIFYGKSKWDILPRGILGKAQALKKLWCHFVSWHKAKLGSHTNLPLFQQN